MQHCHLSVIPLGVFSVITSISYLLFECCIEECLCFETFLLLFGYIHLFTSTDTENKYSKPKYLSLVVIDVPVISRF